MPAEKIPHQNSSFLSPQSTLISQTNMAMAQRISSARLHKIKELKNEIFDLQHKLEASSLENQVLKQLQGRYSKAISRYKNSRSSLMTIVAHHSKEVTYLKELLMMSQKDERNKSRKLRKVEAELQKAKDALQTLHMLSEDKALAEREELDHRLSVLTEKMELNDKKIQSLEKQLKLNNSTFSRQLASENKKAVEAGITTVTLRMEINSLRQKIKEKDRQLYVKNIYANRMLKIPKERSDAASQEKIGLSINRSIQVDKQSFRSLLPSQYQTQETEKSPVQLTKGKKSSEDKNQNTEANEACTDAQCRTDKSSTNKIPKPETFNRTHREYVQEGRPLMEEYTCLEFMKEETDLLQKLMKTELTPPTDSLKKNNQEEDAVEEYEKEGKKPDEQLSNSEKAESECLTPDPRNTPPIRLKKKYIFSEATENLHHGLFTSGRNSLCSHRHAGQESSETADSKVKNSSGLYEPSFCQVPKARQKESSTEIEGSTHMTFAERKKI